MITISTIDYAKFIDDNRIFCPIPYMCADPTQVRLDGQCGEPLRNPESISLVSNGKKWISVSNYSAEIIDYSGKKHLLNMKIS
jgi:hypothetical protein